MSNRFEEIARRKQVLIDRCARDREELSASCRRIHLPLGLGAVLTVLGKILKSYPILVAGISSLLIGSYGSKLTKSAGTLFRLGQAFCPFGPGGPGGANESKGNSRYLRRVIVQFQ